MQFILLLVFTQLVDKSFYTPKTLELEFFHLSDVPLNKCGMYTSLPIFKRFMHNYLEYRYTQR